MFFVGGASGTVVNAGLISSNGNVGLYLGQGGIVTNAVGGMITGFWGVGFNGSAGTLTNDGSIVGSLTNPAVFLDEGGWVSNAAGAIIEVRLATVSS